MRPSTRTSRRVTMSRARMTMEIREGRGHGDGNGDHIHLNLSHLPAEALGRTSARYFGIGEAFLRA